MKINNELIDFDYLTMKLAQNNMLKTNEFIGEEATINDSVNAKIVDMSVFGKKKQKQYEGTNLLKPKFISKTSNNMICTITEKGWLIDGLQGRSKFYDF